jgi:uncharacterized protein YciI
MMMAQYGGVDIKPWSTQLIEGNVDDILRHERAQEQRQKRESSEMLALGARQDADLKWHELNSLITRFGQIASQYGPQELAMRGIRPPTLADVGVEIPMPEYFDKDPEHIIAMEQVLLSEGYDKLHPLVKQALREHHNAHLQRIQQNALSVAGQMAPTEQPQQAPPPGEAEEPDNVNAEDKPEEEAPSGDEQQQ